MDRRTDQRVEYLVLGMETEEKFVTSIPFLTQWEFRAIMTFPLKGVIMSKRASSSKDKRPSSSRSPTTKSSFFKCLKTKILFYNERAFERYHTIFITRPLAVERHVNLFELVNPMLSTYFDAQAWDLLLSGVEKAFPRLVRLFYVNINHASRENSSFHTVVDGHSITVTPDLIAESINFQRILRALIFPFEDSVVPDLNKVSPYPRVLVGHDLQWSSSFRIAQCTKFVQIITMIAGSNLYPCLGNKRLIKPPLANLLYFIISGIPVDITSLIIHVMMNIHLSSTSKLSLPFLKLIGEILFICNFKFRAKEEEKGN